MTRFLKVCVLSILSCILVDAINVQSLDYEVKSGQVLGSEISFAQINTYVDEEVYLIERYNYRLCAPPNIATPNGTSSCAGLEVQCLPICNYATSGSACGSQVASDVNETLCGTLGFPSSCPTTDYCNSTLHQWVQLSENQEIEGFVSNGQFNQYRFFFDPTQFNNGDSCWVIVVQVDSLSGDPDLYLSTDGPITDRYQSPLRGLLSGGERIRICPSTAAGGEYTGTFYAAVYGWRTAAYTIRYYVEQQQVPNYIIAESPSSCQRYDPGLQYDTECLFEDQWYTGVLDNNDAKFQYTMDNSSECQTLRLTLISLTGDSDIYVGMMTNDSNITWKWVSYNFGLEDGVSFVYCQDMSDSPPTFRVAISPYISPTNYSFYFHVDRNVSQTPKTRVADMKVSQGTYDMPLTATITCNGTTSVKYQCFAWYDCTPMHPVFPGSDPLLLWPLPNVLEGNPSFQGILGDVSYVVPDPKKLVSLIVLNYNSGSSQGTYLDASDLSECSIEYLGRYTNSLGMPILGTYSFPTRSQPSCDYTQFSNLKNQVESYLEQMDTTTVDTQLLSYNFQVESVTFTNSWVGCIDLANSFVQTSPSSLLIKSSTACYLQNETSPEYFNDGCCNQIYSFYGLDVCVPRDTYDPSFITYGDIIGDQIQSQCKTMQCSQTAVDEYKVNQQFISDASVGCASIIENSELELITQVSRPYYSCYVSVFGSDSQGVTCNVDADCGNYTCSVVTGKCLVPYKNQEMEFMQCYVKIMGSIVELYFQEMWNLPVRSSVGDDAYIQALLPHITTNDCTGEYTIAMDQRFHWRNEHSDYQCFDNCPSDFFYCPARICPLPRECFQVAEGACGRIWTVRESSPEICSQDYHCNWLSCDSMSRDQCESACNATSDYICALCEGDSCEYFIDSNITNSKSCQEKQICIYADGSTSDTCIYGTCSLYCPGCDKAQCESSGYCSDEIIYPPGVTEICVFALEYIQSADGGYYLNSCPYYDEVLNNIGCVDYIYPNRSICEMDGGVWYTKATNEAECASYGFGCYEDQFAGSSLSYKNASTCALVNGTMLPYFTWTSGTYLPGTLRNMSWIAPSFSTKYSWSASVNYTFLYDTIVSAASQSYSFILKTNLLCRYNKVLATIANIACDCTNSGQSNCFEGKLNIQVGTGRGCPQNANVINAPPSVLTFDETSVSDECVTVHISIAAANQFTVSESVALGSTSSQTSSYNAYASVTNSDGAIVGQLIGDGVSIDYSDVKYVDHFTLCLLPRNEIQRDKEFVDYDFGLSTDAEEISPMNLEMTVENDGSICAIINPNKYPQNSEIFPILRIKLWETKKQVSFSSVETGFIYLIAVVYLISFIGCIFNIYWLFAKEKVTKKGFFPRRILFLFFGCENLVRLIYYFMLPSGDLKPTFFSTFILSELPTFLLFTSITIMLFIWGITLYDRLTTEASIEHAVRKLRIRCIAANILMYLVLLLLIILFFSLPNDAFTSSQMCGLTIKNLKPTSQTAHYKLSIVYKSFLSILAFSIAAGFAFYGIALGRKINALKSKSQQHLKKLFIVTLSGGISFLIHAILLVVLASTPTSFLGIIIVLTITELIPEYLLFYMYGIKFVLKPFGSDKSTERNSKLRSQDSSRSIDLHRANSVQSFNTANV